MSQFWDEGIYHGECCHIFSDDIHNPDCIRRYYEITPLRGERQRIIVCNEWLRLKVRENAYKWSGDCRAYRPYEYTVQEIVNVYFPVDGSFPFRKEKQSRVNPSFNYCICKRPYITSEIHLFDAVNLVMESQENFSLHEFNDSFLTQIYSQIYEVARYLDKYNKYKRKKEEIRLLLRHLNTLNFDPRNNDRITKLFILFFEIQSYINSQS